MNDADAKMGKSVEATREEFAAIRAGRANPAMFAKITADYYGTPTPLQQLASFSAQDARTILIQPFDIGAMGNIERAIRDSDLGVNPANDGKVLRCVFPELTEERRKEFIKLAKSKAEDGRVSVVTGALIARLRCCGSGRRGRGGHVGPGRRGRSGRRGR